MLAGLFAAASVSPNPKLSQPFDFSPGRRGRRAPPLHLGAPRGETG